MRYLTRYIPPRVCIEQFKFIHQPRSSLLKIKSLPGNRWEICLSMREQNEPRNCVEYTQCVFTKRHNRVNIAKCLYKINDCFVLKMDMIKLIIQNFLVTFYISTLPLSLVGCPCAYFDLKQLLLCCRKILKVYMKIEASHAFYNLVNCMSPYFYAYT
jgi:hypothetical protein